MRKYSTLLIKQVASFVWLLYNFNTRNKLSNEGVFYHCIGNIFLCISYSHSLLLFLFVCFLCLISLTFFCCFVTCFTNQRTNGILKNKHKEYTKFLLVSGPLSASLIFLFSVSIYFQVFYINTELFSKLVLWFCYFGNNWKQQQGKLFYMILNNIKKRGNLKKILHFCWITFYVFLLNETSV